MSDTRTPAKRAACDRCRTQKLKCIRIPDSLNPTELCIRCLRSNFECTSSSSKRPGRPRNSTNSSRPTDLQPSAVDDWFNLEMMDAGFETSSWNTVNSGFASMSSGDTAQIISSLSTTSPDGVSNSAFLTGLITETSLTEPRSNLQSERGDLGMLQLSGQQFSPGDINLGLCLSTLQRELSKLHFTLKTMSWDMSKTMLVTCTNDASGNPSIPSQTDFGTNPLAQMAATTTEFTRLLSSIQTAAANGEKASANNVDPLLSIYPCLSISDLLSILSCHMLIVSIYDCIFSYFMDQVLQNPAAINTIMQSAPKFYLGGIAVPPRLGMLSHLLYCLVESHIQPIESLLGLPDESCVFWKNNSVGQDQQPGLFSGQSGQLLCAALMKLEAEKPKSGRSGLGIVESLREKIRRAQGPE
ncbi:hypothetical protein EJ07DRAFT_153227 [Lizonia empirigonia]|nr:hypothetical protein EJ07DRAFT_153227 [Lizonia empirigonia]